MLSRAGERISTVYFPETAVISTLQMYSDGSMIEMANIGREACTGVNLVLGNPYSLTTNEVQVRGACIAMTADSFLSLKAAHPEFERALYANVQAVFYQVMVSGACNGAHDSKQRLARWLLSMDDRSDKETLHLTHEFLGEILGLRRATVTKAASELQEAGLIEYARGDIRITDHAGLRAESCECYDLVRQANEALLPEDGGNEP
ncbi:Crp/Fnr family transcriptional regulator [Hyphococcus sp.]|uniref:Crp/Fnr family transcriptional regulator n=1 Tax=Hyphococcus sp. TaxID=2038636 RepID=UPI003CCB88EE